jgi:hypothetical protein
MHDASSTLVRGCYSNSHNGSCLYPVWYELCTHHCLHVCNVSMYRWGIVMHSSRTLASQLGRADYMVRSAATMLV